MNKNVGVALIISAHNRASMVINQMVNGANAKLATLQKRTSEMADKSFKAGTQMVGAGVAMLAPVAGAVKAYADQESAMLGLQSVMMNSSGRVGREFEKMNKLAIQLGNELPGDTAEFYQLFETMIRNGGKAQDILAGTGKAAAYLAVQLKIPSMQAGETMQRMQVATGTANKDMMAFADTLARVNQLGPSVQEMEMAFFRSSGALKTMKIQGLAATKEMANVFAMLIRSGSSGEIAGSGVKAMLTNMGNATNVAKFDAMQKSMGLNMKFTDAKTGDFLGIEHMMKQFDAMKNLTTKQKGMLIRALVGEGGDAEVIAKLVNEGMVGYRKMQAEQERQASLEQKVALQLKSLKNMWEAVRGTMINVAAEIGKSIGPQLKNLMDRINDFLPKITSFVDRHRTLVTWVLKTTIVLGGLALAGGGVKIAFAGLLRGFNILIAPIRGAIFVVRHLTGLKRLLGLRMFQLVRTFKLVGTAVRAFGMALMTNPLTLYIAAALAIAAIVYVIIRNWSKIKEFFEGVWRGVVKAFNSAVEWVKKIILNFTPVGLIYQHWGKITGFFWSVWENVKKVFGKAVGWVMGLGKRFFDAGKNIVKSIWQGIKNMAHLPVDAIQGIAKKMREYLPFSPAKTGPLRDIHRVKLVETIAMSMKPQALVQAWNKTLTSFNASVNNSRPQIGGGGGGAIGGGQMVFAPVIHLNGGATKADANMLTKELEKQFEKLMREWQFRNERIRY